MGGYVYVSLTHLCRTGMYVSIYMYLCIIYPAFVTLVPEICARPEMLCVFRYINILMCVIYNCTQPIHADTIRGRIL